MILVIDNYDSFTYNLIEYFKILDEEVKVFRNDKIKLEDIKKMDIDYICISPGPKEPKDAGISLDIIHEFKGKIPIIGICLGHQAICEYFGAKVIKAKEPKHGKVEMINHYDIASFKGLENPIQVTRYHSLVIDEETLPKDIIITSRSKDGEIMGIKHENYDIEGFQFHPEAILTNKGIELLRNFIKKGN